MVGGSGWAVLFCWLLCRFLDLGGFVFVVVYCLVVVVNSVVILLSFNLWFCF